MATKTAVNKKTCCQGETEAACRGKPPTGCEEGTGEKARCQEEACSEDRG